MECFILSFFRHYENVGFGCSLNILKSVVTFKKKMLDKYTTKTFQKKKLNKQCTNNVFVLAF